jgi:hypothetical protein
MSTGAREFAHATLLSGAACWNGGVHMPVCDRLTAAIEARDAEIAAEARRGALLEVERDLRGIADGLAEWMKTQPLNSPKRVDLSRRASEWGAAADRIAALPKEPAPTGSSLAAVVASLPGAGAVTNATPRRAGGEKPGIIRDDSTNVKPAAPSGVAPRNADPNHDGVGGMECPNHPGQTCIARAQCNGLCVYTCAIDNTGSTPEDPR